MDVVSELQRELASQIGDQRFRLWFGTGVRLAMDGDALAVAVSDQFILERLRKQFLANLRAAAQCLLGRIPKIEFVIDASLRPEVEAACAEPGAAADNSPDSAGGNEPAVPTPGTEGSPRKGRRFHNLDSFVVGTGNRVAFTAASSIAERPGAVTPLYVYGPTGCGKSHLLEGIWSATRRRHRGSRVLYLSAEQFTSHFLEALRGGGLPSFRHKTRHVDLLIIDDVQFFAGKRATLVELQHTLDALLRDGRQLVLAADRSPTLLVEFGSEFANRVAGGLVCGLEPPDYETRRGIAARLAAAAPVSIPTEVVDYLARELPADGRQIAGALNRLVATSQALQQTVTLAMADGSLRDLTQVSQRVVQLTDIEKAVCSAFGLAPRTLRDTRKTKSVSHPRMLAMWLARKYTRAASSEISQYFGRRSHSTVISAEKKVNRWVQDGATVQLGGGTCSVADAIHRAETQLRTG